MAFELIQPATLQPQETLQSYLTVDQDESHQIPPPFDGLLTELAQRKSGAEERLLDAKAFFARYDFHLDEQSRNVRARGAGERIHKDIRMRVRYTCHNCQVSFGREKLCLNCQHRRCSRCARYPAKRDHQRIARQRPSVSELPLASPEPASELPSETQLDAQISKTTCHECQTQSEMDLEICPNCQHKICERCPRERSVTLQTPSASEDVATVHFPESLSLEDPVLPPEQKPPPGPTPVVSS